MVVAERIQRDKQIAFWKLAHSEDTEQVVEADSARMRRLAAHGDLGWAQGRLRNIKCPTLLTALSDRSLPDVGSKNLPHGGANPGQPRLFGE